MVSPFTSKTEFDVAVGALLSAADAYYHGDTLEMSDSAYDALVARIEASVAANPTWDARGLLDKVAAGTAGTGTVTHAVPMLSLSKATTTDELESFTKKVRGLTLVTEVKLDGLAVAVEYVDGRLTNVATRGDGTTGEDVTAQATAITGLPTVTDPGFTATIRGEVFMTDSDFETSNTARVAAGDAPFKNPRNAVAGSLRKEGSRAHMTFAAYDAYGPAVNHLDTHIARIERIERERINTARALIAYDALGEPADVIAHIENIRPNLGFPIDGAVVKVNSIAERDRIGVASRHPKWAIAWKYAAEETTSTLRDIHVTVGRTGRVAYTAIIDPVYVAGATVSRATLHNAEFIAVNRLGIGSDVLVTRANDVIPRIVGLDTPNNATIAPWEAPATCPQCEQPLDTSQVNWRCHSPECSLVGWISYFAARNAMDIDGLGESIIIALVENGHLNTPADLYNLTIGDLATLELAESRVLGEKNAAKIHSQIQKSKGQPLNRVITALGIRLTGRSVSRWLANEFTTMDALRDATVEEVAAIEGMGDIKAAAVVQGLRDRGHVIDALAVAGVNMGSEPTEQGNLPLAGMTVVVTGAMSGPLASKSRNEMNELIEAMGGKASGSVSGKTSLLVCGEPGSSKYVKAESLGVRIVTPEEFASILEG